MKNLKNKINSLQLSLSGRTGGAVNFCDPKDTEEEEKQSRKTAKKRRRRYRLAWQVTSRKISELFFVTLTSTAGFSGFLAIFLTCQHASRTYRFQSDNL
ncbi:hypothetical protein Q5P01_019059 [Channa striata]|uniref:Uncharacterized protein n=1 Tax=Channa striata TaxID=64152 RepID=A0AA88S4B3_CHASR|nr:hypothetical protein Q5P01_019059 [Channa striata]